MKKKVIILEAPLISDYNGEPQYTSMELQNMTDSFEYFKKEERNIPFDLDFEFWRGSDIFRINNVKKYYVFSEKELLNAKQEIDELINSNQLFGLILDTKLTKEEMEKWVDDRYTKYIGETFAKLLQYFYKKIPTFHIRPMYEDEGIIKMYEFEFLQKINHYYMDQGYFKQRNGGYSIYINYDFQMMEHFFEACSIHFYKMQEEKLELSLIKKD